jgi:hypothetical protein
MKKIHIDWYRILLVMAIVVVISINTFFVLTGGK